MNEAIKRQKVMQVFREMDTDNLIDLLGMAPEQIVPRPSMDELQQLLIKESEQESDNVTPDDFFFGYPDPNIKEADYSPRTQTVRASQVAHDLSAFLGEKPQQADYSRLRVAGPGKMVAKKPDIDLDTPEVEYLGQLYENDGSEPENNSDDAGWL